MTNTFIKMITSPVVGRVLNHDKDNIAYVNIATL